MSKMIDWRTARATAVMISLLLGFGAITVHSLVTMPPARWEIGDTACFKLSGRVATVQWYSRNPWWVHRPTNYTVASMNDFGQVYLVDLYETDLKECEDK